MEDHTAGWKRLKSCIEAVVQRNITFTGEQIQHLLDIGVELFSSDFQNYVEGIMDLILKGSDYEPRTKMEHTHKPYSSDPRENRVWDLMVDVMKRGEIIPQDTNALFCDIMVGYFGNKDSQRDGVAIFTDTQIILTGRFAAWTQGRATNHQLYYEDYENKPYLASVDFIDYDKIESVEPVWKMTSKGIKLKYRTKYVKTKNRVLYGPYFFKFDLAKKIDAIDGVLDITIQSSPYHEDSKQRHEAIVKKLMGLLSGIDSRTAL
ncbi:MAG: hypothetical protein P1Q69_05615 [Candidatus Thorarchaeota archaeon]|nr:hypothetical protein [Candidatus Thorarchaeota archaeon]